MSDGEFIGWMRAIQQEMETLLAAQLPNPEHEPRALNAAMRYATLGGGKRVRALLVFAAGALVNAAPAALGRAAVAAVMRGRGLFAGMLTGRSVVDFLQQANQGFALAGG